MPKQKPIYNKADVTARDVDGTRGWRETLRNVINIDSSGGMLWVEHENGLYSIPLSRVWSVTAENYEEEEGEE